MKYIECIFVKEMNEQRSKSPLIDVDYHSEESIITYVKAQVRKGITHFLLFGVPHTKTVESGINEGAIVPKTIRKLKAEFGSKIILYADVGLSPYREDGHSTVITNGVIDADASYEAAAKLAVAFASAGADYIAPCLSLPKQVEKLKKALDEHNLSAKIMAYSSKFSSALYGPYRDTIQSNLGLQKKEYQTDMLNSKEALMQLRLDENQHASIVMVKPGLFYLDIVQQAKEYTTLPVSVYHVSGEYTMMKLAAQNNVADENELFDELHSAFKRAGADYVIGYAPDHFVRWLKSISNQT